MTAALSPTAATMPTAATPNPLAALTGRVKRIDPNELMAVANEVAAHIRVAHRLQGIEDLILCDGHESKRFWGGTTKQRTARRVSPLSR